MVPFLVWTLERYVSLVLRSYQEDENFTYRLRTRELPQLFHGCSSERQPEILAERPRLTGLPFWDAMLCPATARLTRNF